MGAPAFAARVETIDGVLEGPVQSFEAGLMTVAVDDELRKLPLADVDHVVIAKASPQRLKLGVAAPGGPIFCRAAMTDGDVLLARLENWTYDRIRLEPAATEPSDVLLDVPRAHLGEIWFGTDEQIHEARTFATSDEDPDFAFVLDKKGSLKRLAAELIGLHEASLVLRFDGRDRRIGLDRVVGVRLAPGGRAAPTTGFHQRFTLRNGDSITGHLIATTPLQWTIRTKWDQQTRWTWTAIAAVHCRNGRRVRLDHIEPSRVEQTPWFDRVMQYRVGASLTGSEIRLRNQRYRYGLSVHSRCVLTYALAGAFEKFRSTVGFQQPEGVTGRAVIRVRGDGRVLFENLDARGDKDPIPLSIDITGVEALVLEVDFGPGQDVGDRVVWADAQLIRPPVH
ncbi:MAG: hypothetical protein CMJ18_20175 [Phycisphaeraceae bacterium]|nr:hypothetical protein [Phycisphaeraceae bacterium]